MSELDKRLHLCMTLLLHSHLLKVRVPTSIPKPCSKAWPHAKASYCLDNFLVIPFPMDGISGGEEYACDSKG